jgi:hypothetical protein
LLYYYACCKLIIVNKIVNLAIFLKNSLIHLIQVTKVKKKSFNGFYDPRLHAKSDGKSIQKEERRYPVCLLLDYFWMELQQVQVYFIFILYFWFVSGRQYNGNGNAQPWWSESTIEAFTKQNFLLFFYVNN